MQNYSYRLSETEIDEFELIDPTYDRTQIPDFKTH